MSAAGWAALNTLREQLAELDGELGYNQSADGQDALALVEAALDAARRVERAWEVPADGWSETEMGDAIEALAAALRAVRDYPQEPQP